MMNRFEIAQRLSAARDLLYEAKSAADRNDTCDKVYKVDVGCNLNRIINQLKKVQLILKSGREQQP